MAKLYGIICFTMVGFTWLTSLSSNEPSPANGNSLSIPPVVHCGILQPGKRYETLVPVTNESGYPLRILGSTSQCFGNGCLSVKGGITKIPPHATGEITIVIKTPPESAPTPPGADGVRPFEVLTDWPNAKRLRFEVQWAVAEPESAEEVKAG